MSGIAKVEAYLASKKESSSPEIASKFAELEDFYNKKLWHQLTLGLVEVVKMPKMQEGTELLNLYSHIISEMENKINPMSLVALTEAIIGKITDNQEAVKFVEKICPKVSDHKEATVYCKILIGQITLCRIKDIETAKELLSNSEKILDEVDGVTPTHGRFYKLLSDLYCQQGAHADFYRASLRYLGCSELPEDMTERVQLAFYTGLAALLGEGIYNFGELLAHPVLQSLNGTENEWLVKILMAFNSGDLATFEAMSPKWKSQPDLLAKEVQLREKIRLLCLMEMAFKRNAFDRQLKFKDIAQETGLDVNSVELMVMRALSLELVKGSIDEVEEKVLITWVQPRVLSKQQLGGMVTRISEMLQDVGNMQSMLHDNARPILTL